MLMMSTKDVGCSTVAEYTDLAARIVAAAEAAPDPKAEPPTMPDNDVIFGPPRPDNSPAPEVHTRPFRVGDVVRLKPGCVPMVTLTTGAVIMSAEDWTGPSEVSRIADDGDVWIEWGGEYAWLAPSCLESATPEPARAWPKLRAMSEAPIRIPVLLHWRGNFESWGIGFAKASSRGNLWEVLGESRDKSDDAFLGWLPLPTLEETQ